jgi:hypothetical protein
MPVTTSYPGIYIQEAPSTSHTIIAAPTNIAVFIGYTHPLKTASTNLNKAVQIFSFSDYQAQFGGFVRSGAFYYAFGLDPQKNQGAFGDMAQAVSQFFLNGGTNAYVVSLHNGILTGLTPCAIWLASGSPPGTWQLEVAPLGHTAPSNAIVFTATEVTDENFAMSITIRPGTAARHLAAHFAAVNAGDLGGRHHHRNVPARLAQPVHVGQQDPEPQLYRQPPLRIRAGFRRRGIQSGRLAARHGNPVVSQLPAASAAIL